MKPVLFTVIGIILSVCLIGQTNPTPQSLPYNQSFASLPHSSSSYPVGIQGWSVGSPATSYNVTTPTADRDMTASGNASLTTAGIYNYSGKIGFLNGTFNFAVALAINTANKQNVRIDYRTMVIRNPYNGSSNTRINECTLQYRIGISGDFTNISGLEYQNGTISQTNATINEQNPVSRSLTLPNSCIDQPVVQIRWISRDVSGSGNRPSFAIDDISITADPITLPVELTGFSVSPGVNNNANITWITQSETGVNGFYILRGGSDMLSEAVIISPLISASNTSTTQSYCFADTEIPVAGSYYYWLQSLDYNGEISYFGPQILSWNPGESGNPAPPLDNAIKAAYPNPFNPSLTVAYALTEVKPVQIMIYNNRGQLIRTFDQGMMSAAEHKLIWDGRDNRREGCPSGVYRIVLQAGKLISTKKVLLLK